MQKARDGGQSGESIPSRAPFPEEAAGWFWAAVWGAGKKQALVSNGPCLSFLSSR